MGADEWCNQLHKEPMKRTERQTIERLEMKYHRVLLAMIRRAVFDPNRDSDEALETVRDLFSGLDDIRLQLYAEGSADVTMKGMRLLLRSLEAEAKNRKMLPH